MLRALLWKEWRAQRSLVLAALALATVLPAFLMAGAMAGAPNARLHEVSRILIPLHAMLVWPLFAAATAGSSLAGDMGDGTMKFLLSRPVSRARVWLVKVGVALAAFVAVVVGTTLLSVVFLWLSAANSEVFWNTLRTDFGDSLEPEVLIAAIPFVFLFGCSVYCSTFMKRPMMAALGGFAVAAAMAGTIGLVWWALSPSSEWLGQSMLGAGAMVGVPLATVSIYAAAFWVFRHGDINSGELRRRAWQPLLGITVVVLLVGAVPAAYTGMRSMASSAGGHVGDLRVVNDGVVLPELSPGGFTTALVRRPLDGSASSVVVAEKATNPALSPNGEWVVYAGYSVRLSADPHLRAVRVDGSDDHAISGPLPGWDWGYGYMSILIAPDNDSVAFVGYRDALLASISGGPDTVELDLADERRSRARDGVIGWSAGAPAELLYYRIVDRFRTYPRRGGTPGTEPGSAMLRTELLAFDPRTGEDRLVRGFAGSHRLQVRSRYAGYSPTHPRRAWAWLPIWLATDDGLGLHLIDTAGGEVIDLSRSACRNWGFSTSGTRFVYGGCSGELRSGDLRAELRVYDLVSGADEPFALLEGYQLSSLGWEMFLSPDGRRLLLYARHGYSENHGTHVVSRNGVTRMLAESLLPVGWRNGTEALLVRAFGSLELHVVNVDTGRDRVVFP